MARNITPDIRTGRDLNPQPSDPNPMLCPVELRARARASACLGTCTTGRVCSTLMLAGRLIVPTAAEG